MTKSNEDNKPVEAKQEIPPYKEGFTTIQLDNQDVRVLINLLVAAKDAFSKQALSSLDAGDENGIQVFTMRAKLSGAFAERLAQHSTIGEPVSREIH